MKKLIIKSLCALFFVSTVSLSAGGGDSFAGGMAGGMFGGLMSGAMTRGSSSGSGGGGVSYRELSDFREDVVRRLQRFEQVIDEKLKEFEVKIKKLEK